MADQFLIEQASAVVSASPELITITSDPFFHQLLAYSPQAVIFIAAVLIIWRAHVSAGSKFNAFDYFTDEATGKASITRTLQIVGGFTATWIVVKMAVATTLSTEMFGVYLAALGVSAGWSKYIGAKFGAANSAPASVNDASVATEQQK